MSPLEASTSVTTKIATNGFEDEETELESRQSQGSSPKSVLGNKKSINNPYSEPNRSQEFDIDKEEVKFHGSKNTVPFCTV